MIDLSGVEVGPKQDSTELARFKPKPQAAPSLDSDDQPNMPLLD